MDDLLKKPNKIIYIAGYGRSGSTLLERVLQLQPEIHAGGELVNFFDYYSSQHNLCTCGQPFISCSFWGGVARQLEQEGFPVQDYPYFSKLRRKCEAALSHGGALFRSGYHQEYIRLTTAFFKAVFSQLKAPRHILTDSSKTAFAEFRRPENIYQLKGFKIKAVHLVRDPRGVVWSMQKGLNRDLEAGRSHRKPLIWLRAVMGWIRANRTADSLRTVLGKMDCCLIQYEDLAVNPMQTLERLQAVLEINLGRSINIAAKVMQGQVTKAPAAHQLAGNRMRFNPDLTIKLDSTWKQRLGPAHNKLIIALAGPLMRKYGYLTR